MRCDADGNIWAGARPGVLVIAPDGATIGMIRLPETCANVCFGGARRNRLFMTASQSLYAVYVGHGGRAHCVARRIRDAVARPIFEALHGCHRCRRSAAL